MMFVILKIPEKSALQGSFGLFIAANNVKISDIYTKGNIYHSVKYIFKTIKCHKEYK